MSIEVVAVAGDLHYPHVDLATWRAFNAWVRAVRPHRLIINGDYWDLPQVSSHAPEVSEGTAVLPPVRNGANALNTIAESVGEGGVDFLEGNHEARLYKKLVQPIAYQLAGLEHLLSLEAIARAHGLSDRVRWKVENCANPVAPYQVGQFEIRHGHNQAGRFGGGRTPAATLLHKDAGSDRSLVMGHFHRPQQYTCGNRTFIVNAHMEAPVHYPGGMDGWCRGWLAFYLDTETNYAQAVPMWSNSGRFVWEGRVFDGNEDVRKARALAEAPPEGEFRVEFTEDKRKHPMIYWPPLFEAATLADVAEIYCADLEVLRKRWWRFKDRHGRVPRTGAEFDALIPAPKEDAA